MTNFTDIRDFLRAHCARYPELALQDVFKALYQSAFGCEHLIADPSAAADYIRAEAARSGDRISELVELLGGDYCRVHLGILQDGLSAETFARLFALSARHEECGREKLEAMLTALQTMADAGELPFSAQETAEAVERWRKDGFPPLHHSEIFRQNYAPAYRVLRRDFARALPLFARIDRLTAERSRVLVAIEGGSASGKTTLGELLQNVYGCPVFHMDDFFATRTTSSEMMKPWSIGFAPDLHSAAKFVLRPMAASAATIRNLLMLLSVVARPAGMTPTLHRMDIARKPRMNHGNTDFILTLTPWSPLCAAAFFLRCTLMAAKTSTVGMMASVRVSLTIVAKSPAASLKA